MRTPGAELRAQRLESYVRTRIASTETEEIEEGMQEWEEYSIGSSMSKQGSAGRREGRDAATRAETGTSQICPGAIPESLCNRPHIRIGSLRVSASLPFECVLVPKGGLWMRNILCGSNSLRFCFVGFWS